MAYTLNEGQGSLFRNDKQGNDRRPDYRGDIMINGTTYRLVGWVKQGQKGQFLSLKAEQKEQRDDTAGFKQDANSQFEPLSTAQPGGFHEEDGDLPF